MAPSSREQYRLKGLKGSQERDSMSAGREQAEVVVALRASIRPMVLSKEPVASSQASVGCQDTL